MSNPLFKSAVLSVVVACMTVSPAHADQKICGGNNSLVGDTGLIRVGTDLGPDSYWALIYNGLNYAGHVTDQQKLAFLNALFGTSFATLAEVAAFNIDGVREFADLNANGYICVAVMHGTRTSRDDPDYGNYWFYVWDDKEFKNLH